MLKGEYLLIKSGFLKEYAARRFNVQKSIDSPAYKDFAANRFEQAIQKSRNILSFESGNAIVDISGPLSIDGPDICDLFCGIGGCSYLSIQDSISQIQNDLDPTKGKAILRMNTPGGAVDGCDATFQAIWQLSQTHDVEVHNMGLIASAGEWLASAAHRIVAKTPVAMQGSIGVVLNTFDFTGMMESYGIEEIVITNFESPDKIPDLKTDKGKEIVIEELNAIHDVFVGRVLQGRQRAAAAGAKAISRDEINGLKGRVLVAQKAVEVGLTDVIEDASRADSKGSAFSASLKQIGKTPAFKDFPLADIDWDADAADRRWREFTGSTEEPTTEYKDGKFWFDDEKPELFGSYKLGFVDIVDGKPHAIRRGVFAANGAMQGARGGVDMPDEDRPRVQSHIDRYRSKIEKEDEENESKNNREGKSMKLSQFLDENPEAKAEHEASLSAEREKGVESVRAVITAAAPFIESDTYPAAIKTLALKTIKGETDAVALTAAVAAVDAATESSASTVVKKEVKKQSETPPGAQTDHEDKKGKVENIEDYGASVNNLRHLQGMAPLNAGGAS